MEFLEEYGIKKDTIESILEQYNDNVIFNFITSKSNVVEIIDYLLVKKVEDIDLFLANNFELFLKPISVVKEALPTEDWVHALENGSVTLKQILT